MDLHNRRESFNWLTIYLFKHRARREYWENLWPASGRPLCPSLSKPDAWGIMRENTETAEWKEIPLKPHLEPFRASILSPPWCLQLLNKCQLYVLTTEHRICFTVLLCLSKSWMLGEMQSWWERLLVLQVLSVQWCCRTCFGRASRTVKLVS